MALKGSTVKSRASGNVGIITKVEDDFIKVSFAPGQDVPVPFEKAETLLLMDDEVKEEFLKEFESRNKETKSHKQKSKVETYMDNFEEEVLEIEDEPLEELTFEEEDE